MTYSSYNDDKNRVQSIALFVLTLKCNCYGCETIEFKYNVHDKRQNLFLISSSLPFFLKKIRTKLEKSPIHGKYTHTKQITSVHKRLPEEGQTCKFCRSNVICRDGHSLTFISDIYIRDYTKKAKHDGNDIKSMKTPVLSWITYRIRFTLKRIRNRNLELYNN